MRSILALIALACLPPFCQPALCQDDAGQKLNDNLRQRLTEILNPQAQSSTNTPAPRLLRATTGLLAPPPCSIPLLNAIAPGKPVPMPNLMPRALPRPGLTRPNTPATPPPLDRMSIEVPAPACPANFAHIAAPPPSPAPATKP